MDEAVSVSLSTNTYGKGMNPCLFLSTSVYSIVKNTMKAQDLKFWGGGEGSGLAFTTFTKGT